MGHDDVSPFQPRLQQPFLQRTFPVTRHLAGYPRRSLRRDLVAGITVAALAIPSAMAYAEIAGLEPIHGLYALLLPAVAYMVFGSSRQVIVGPEGALAVLVATAVAPVADDADQYAAAAALLAVLVAAVFALARWLQLGWVADYFSRPVLVGYIHGVAVVLIVGQLGKLLGLSIDADDAVPQFAEVVTERSDIDGLTLVIGTVSLAALVALRWQAPKVPAALVVVIAGIVLSAAADLDDRGVAVIGDIPSGLPSVTRPALPLRDALALVPAALGIFLVSFADGILTARSFAGQHGQRVDADQELVAFAAANLSAGVTQGFPVGASGSRTAVNDQMGGRTQVVGSIAALVVAVVLLFLTAPVELLPTACLGAVIVGAALGLIEPAMWRALARAGRSQVGVAAVAAVGVVVFGVLPALVLAVLLSIVETVSRSAQPHDAVLGWVDRLGRYADVAVHPSARTTPGVVVYRLDDRLFFANARYVKARVAEAIAGAGTPTHHLVFDAEAVSDLDASGAQALAELHEALRRDGIGLAVARLKQPVRALFDATGLTATIGREHFHPTVRAAIATYATVPDSDTGYTGRGRRRRALNDPLTGTCWSAAPTPLQRRRLPDHRCDHIDLIDRAQLTGPRRGHVSAADPPGSRAIRQHRFASAPRRRQLTGARPIRSGSSRSWRLVHRRSGRDQWAVGDRDQAAAGSIEVEGDEHDQDDDRRGD